MKFIGVATAAGIDIPRAAWFCRKTLTAWGSLLISQPDDAASSPCPPLPKILITADVQQLPSMHPYERLLQGQVIP